jgi:hypothetical protein
MTLSFLGTPRPDWTGGITSTFTFKEWSLNAFLYLRWGQTYFGGYPNSMVAVTPMVVLKTMYGDSLMKQVAGQCLMPQAY